VKTVLSTKKLSLSQKELLLNAGLCLVEYDAIKIEFLPFEAPNTIKNAIFTSQNAVRSVEGKNLSFENTFCVGKKTEALLTKNNKNVIKMSQNASELAHFIQKNYQNEAFWFFSGSKRRDEIPASFKNSKNTLFEVKTYKTTLNSVKFDQKWDGILFFSPSGVSSFTEKNTLGNSTIFCIGETTASEAKKFSQNIIVANATSVESVIAKVAKTLVTYD
tara:strand:+ start:27647 stop:28300 length:654 start_codon:yes stop_codon:yes gene_type:complete